MFILIHRELIRGTEVKGLFSKHYIDILTIKSDIVL